MARDGVNMNILLYNTKNDLHMHILYVDLNLKKVNELTVDMINHNVVTLRRIINHRSSNDILSNFYCDFPTRLKGCMDICDLLDEVRNICGINDIVYKSLIIYTFQKTGIYEFIAEDICKKRFIKEMIRYD